MTRNGENKRQRILERFFATPVIIISRETETKPLENPLQGTIVYGYLENGWLRNTMTFDHGAIADQPTKGYYFIPQDSKYKPRRLFLKRLRIDLSGQTGKIALTQNFFGHTSPDRDIPNDGEIKWYD